jgi:hypothetical protein
MTIEAEIRHLWYILKKICIEAASSFFFGFYWFSFSSYVSSPGLLGAQKYEGMAERQIRRMARKATSNENTEIQAIVKKLRYGDHFIYPLFFFILLSTWEYYTLLDCKPFLLTILNFL